jgi:hypothetical protein
MAGMEGQMVSVATAKILHKVSKELEQERDALARPTVQKIVEGI